MLYIVVVKYPSVVYTVCENSAMAELSQKLLAERISFKVYLQMASNTPITSLETYYEPHYDYVYLYPLREDPKFREVYETQKFQTV
jgi:hypothetical protein